MGRLIVRAGSLRDLMDVVRVEHRCFGQEAYSTTTLLLLLSRYGRFFLVAEVDGRVVGYASATLRGKAGHLVSIAVLPEFRRLGIGKALLKALLERLREAGARSVTLEVSVRNKAAINLYLKMGFKAVGKITRYYQDGSDAIIMELSLEGEG